ncbi:MAG: SDR family NAD(P)-dependent oxidoreductase [Treponema sp.]|nr:SDR family NAD(P)-dependent oxidoreductase [Treponema sp.]
MKNIAIITGASSGMGKEFALQVAQKYDFDEIWIVARRLEKLEKLSEDINKTKHFNIVKPVALDLGSMNGISKLEKLLIQENKKLAKVESGITIGLLINNAGYGSYGPFEETSVEVETQMVQLNCTSLTGLCGIALPFMKKGSVIINTASLAAYMPLGNFAVYAATKAYVLSFSTALAAELKDKGIKVHALCPGSVSTEFANVASNGARPEVKGGIAPEGVVAQCLDRAFKGKMTSLYRLKWKCLAFMSHFVSGKIVARFTYKYNKRPRKPDESQQEKEISLEEFN